MRNFVAHAEVVSVPDLTFDNRGFRTSDNRPGCVASCPRLVILNTARRPPRPGRMLGGRHDARSGAFAFAGYRGAASAG